MAVVLVTGMSGVGKSSVLAELARRGHRVVDTDEDGWCEDVGGERLWLEDRIAALLDGTPAGTLFLQGCVANQGLFYERFDAVVLLSAPLEVMLERVRTRATNDFGKTASEHARIVRDHAEVEPLLRARATAELDTRRPLAEIVAALEAIVGGNVPASRRP